MDYSPLGSSVHGILHTRILQWVSISFSRGPSQPGDWTHVSSISCSGRQILYHWASWEVTIHIMLVHDTHRVHIVARKIEPKRCVCVYSVCMWCAWRVCVCKEMAHVLVEIKLWQVWFSRLAHWRIKGRAAKATMTCRLERQPGSQYFNLRYYTAAMEIWTMLLRVWC